MDRKTFWVVFDGLLMGVLVLAILVVTLWQGGNWLAFAPPGIGIVLFLGITLLGHYADPDIADAAIRHGLAAGFVGSYLTALGFSITGATRFEPSLVKNLTWVIGVIVTFYFGTTTASQMMRWRGARLPNLGPPPPPPMPPGWSPNPPPGWPPVAAPPPPRPGPGAPGGPQKP
jgi:hypothetical protein